MMKSTIIVLAILAAASALPAFNETSLGDSCTVSDYSKVDAAVKSCKTLAIKDMTVPAGQTLTLKLQSGTQLTFKGKLKFGYKKWEGPLIDIKGTNLHVIGESNHVIDGEGAKYWDGSGDKGGKKPKLFRINGASGTFEKINILNCPHQCVSVLKGKSLTLNQWNVDVSAGDKNALGHNTDGFDLSGGDHVTIQNSVVKNQDDCVAVNSGKNYLFHNLQCSGGHGLSLSIGVSKTDSSKNYAENITFSDCTVKNSRNAIHVKTHTDAASGYINGLTYKNIKISGIDHYGINVQEDYKGGSSTGKPSNNIPITNFNIQNVQGTMTSKNSMPVYILCGSSGCKNFKWSGISITGGKKSSQCNFQPSGFKC